MSPTTKKKIPFPFSEPVDETRQRQTLEYWNVVSCWNGRTSHSLTFVAAIDLLNGILSEIDPQKRLAQLTYRMKESLVEHGKKPKQKMPKASNVNSPSQKPKIYLL